MKEKKNKRSGCEGWRCSSDLTILVSHLSANPQSCRTPKQEEVARERLL
jgi:hypothetical protein